MPKFGKSTGFFAAAAFVASFFAVAVPSVVNAEDPYKAYSAWETARSATELTMAPGEVRDFVISYKNVGTATWTNYGTRLISVYTFDSATLKYRESPFRHVQWLDWNHPSAMGETVTGPGNTATFRIKLQAPLKTGTYEEVFRLGVEDLIWMPGGKFSVKITVAGTPVVAITPSVVTSPVTPASTAPAPVTPTGIAAGHKALMLIASSRELSFIGTTGTTLRLGYKNVGTATWSRSGSTPVSLRMVSGTGWGTDAVATLPAETIAPGQLALFDVKLSAPSGVSGTYRPKFQLVVGNAIVESSEFQLPVTITGGAVSAASQTQSSAADFSRIYVDDFINVGPKGPNLRVGLFDTTAPVTIVATGAYGLHEGNGSLVKSLSGVTTIVFDWAGRNYYVSNGGFSWISATYPRFVPDDPANSIFEISSYESRPSWDTSVNFNKFRGTLEVRYSSATGKLWVIEELPIEDYMRGLAETSNASPFEYQKSLVTAARTYAAYVFWIGGKHKSEYFDVVTDGNDQVYKGYASELVRPNVVRAVEATRGQIVSYKDQLVVTPYFSRSDGRTRAWTEVWGGAKRPWLVSMPAPYDKAMGNPLWGHGVGMSALDAYGRAQDGYGWIQILKYYYQGTDIRQLY